MTLRSLLLGCGTPSVFDGDCEETAALEKLGTPVGGGGGLHSPLDLSLQEWFRFDLLT